MSSNRPPIPRPGWLWPWLLGTALGLGLAAVLPWGVGPTDADESVLRFEVDLSRDWTPADAEALAELARENRGRDIVLEPAAGSYRVPPGDQRRQDDEERALLEATETAAWIAQARQRGEISEQHEPPACVAASATRVASPGRYLLCDGGVAASGTDLPTDRATSRAAAEERLGAYVRSVLSGADNLDRTLGWTSSFSDASALASLTLARDGAVTVDFGAAIVPQVERIHPGLASHLMLEQVYSTLFQFREVSSVTLTYAGDCEAFGELIAGPCQSLDRDLWEHMQDVNDRSVEYFALGGVR